MSCLLPRNRRCSSSSSSSSSIVPLSLFPVFFLAIFLEKSVGVVSAVEYSKDKQPSSLTLESIQKYLSKINKPAVLSIESPDGDIIDCIDKWKQPAFDHPLVKNHTMPMVPPRWKHEKKVDRGRGGRLKQVWHLNGTRCPKGTVPIRRTTVDDVLRAKSLLNFGRKPIDDTTNSHEYATVVTTPTPPSNALFGASARINIWNPFVVDDPEHEMTVSQIWLSSGTYQNKDLNTVEAGWQVYPNLYGDTGTRLFAYWTADAYISTGCYNIECQGFTQIDEYIVVGAAVMIPSIGPAFLAEDEIQITKDPRDGHWWLKMDGTTIGYWPSNLFTTLRDSAEDVQWGGEIVNLQPIGAPHTTTQMGSGHFAEEGLGRASYFRQLKVVPSQYSVLVPPPNTLVVVDNPACYNLILAQTNDDWGTHFFYGGPGLNPNCP